MKDEREWAVPQGLTMAEEVALRRKLGLEPKLKGGHMDRKRDGPFEVGDRVRHKEYGFTGTVVDDRDVRPDNMEDVPANFHPHMPNGCWRGIAYGFTLISPTTKPEAQEEIKVGDRFVDRRSVGYRLGWVATIIEVRVGSCSLVWTEPCGKEYPADSWPTVEIEEQLVKLITKQEAGTMQAYNWAIWNKDKDGEKLDIVDQGGLDAFASKTDAEMEIWAAFKAKAENKDALKKDYVVEVVPFGG